MTGSDRVWCPACRSFVSRAFVDSGLHAAEDADS